MRMLKTFLLSAVVGLGLASGAAQASEGHGGAPKLPDHQFQHDSVFGPIDKAAAQRGFEVYKQVCSNCHSLSLLSIRHLAGIGYDEAKIKEIAASYVVKDGPNDQGEMFDRPGLPSDRFPKPFPNTKAAAAANNGALPPDLSLIAKARHDGEHYIYALLTGFSDAPADFKLTDGMFYNPYFPGHQIKMPPPLSEGAVTYEDKTKATVEQMAHDVSTFLTYAAEPMLDARRQLGMKVLMFFVVFGILMYATKRHLWRNVSH
ncbi:ubiquinol-cytochrome c reductase cytochrome c1 subunit [Azospirillaceae bacterium]